MGTARITMSEVILQNPHPTRAASRDRAWARLFLLWLVTGRCSGAHIAAAQTQGRRVTILARATLRIAPGTRVRRRANTRLCSRPPRTTLNATYRLAGCGARAPRALRLFRRYVTLERPTRGVTWRLAMGSKTQASTTKALQWYDEALRWHLANGMPSSGGRTSGAGGTDRRGACRLRALLAANPGDTRRGVSWRGSICVVDGPRMPHGRWSGAGAGRPIRR